MKALVGVNRSTASAKAGGVNLSRTTTSPPASKVPAANRIGAEGEGFKIAMKTLDFTRPGTAAGAVGVAQAAYELAVEYAKERVTFDVPIAMHQGVNFLIADMATEIEASRLLVWQSAALLDHEGLGFAVVGQIET